MTISILGYCLFFFASVLATMGGIGGSGLIIPIASFVEGIEINKAVPLAVSCILGSTLGRLLYLIPKRHPQNKKRFLVDFIPLLIIVPSIGTLSVFGAILNTISPPIVIAILLVIVVSYSFLQTLYKGIKEFQKEIKKEEDSNKDGNKETVDPEFGIKEKEKEKPEETWSMRLKYGGIFLLSFLVVTSFTIGRLFLTRCSLKYWIEIGVQVIVMVIVAILNSWFVLLDHTEKEKNDFPLMEGDITFNFRSISVLSMISLLTGFLASYLGIGGGMFINPPLLMFGMNPTSIIGTSGVSTFFSSLVSYITFMSMGLLNPIESIIIIPVGFFGG